MRRGQGTDDGIDIQAVRWFQELEPTVKINVLPGDGGNPFRGLGASGVAGSFLVLQEPRQDGGVVKDDAVGDQAAAFRPQLLLILQLEAELAETGVGDRSAQLVVILTPVQSLLNVLP